MKDIVKWFDNCPLWLKIVFALPVIDIAWAIYRIIKGCAESKVSYIIGGILWIVLGALALWLVDLVCIIVWKRPRVLA